MLTNNTFSASIFNWFGRRFERVFGRFFGPKIRTKSDLKKSVRQAKSIEKTNTKLMPKTFRFSTSIFSGFGLDFGASWASKSAALLAAPGMLNPTAFFACLYILHVLTWGGQNLPAWRSKLRMLGPCWRIFRSRASFFHSWRVLERFFHFFGSCWSFFSEFGSRRPRFWVVRGGFWSLQNHI